MDPWKKNSYPKTKLGHGNLNFDPPIGTTTYNL
jgi:hypothetical protein